MRREYLISVHLHLFTVSVYLVDMVAHDFVNSVWAFCEGCKTSVQSIPGV